LWLSCCFVSERIVPFFISLDLPQFSCHVIVKDPKIFDLLGEVSDEENDMLDLAFGLTSTSRLGCQIKLRPELNGMELQLPQATRNIAVDGYKASKH